MVAVDEKRDVEAAPAPAVPHFTPSERAARGRSARAECPRSSHADFEIAGRDRDFTDTERARAVLNVVRSYREWMRKLAEARNLDVWYAGLDVETLERNLREQQAKGQAANVARAAAKARTKDSLKAFAKLTHEVDGEPRIVSDPPLIVSDADIAQEAGIQFERLEGVIHGLLREYRRTLQSDRRHLLEEFRMVDLARKVVGVGSVGTRCWIVLLLGRDGDDPLFLQIKEAQASVLEPYLGKSEYENHGERVVAGQQLMQATSDIFLGWLHSKETLDGAERDFFVRQLWDWKTSVDLDIILPEGLELYGEVCGFLLARAHARSGDRIAIASYLGKSDSFDRALAEFAVAYADQNERDHAAVRQAADEGRIAVREGL